MFFGVWSPILPAILVVVVLLLSFLYFRRAKNLPPGPSGLPFLGYLPYLGNKPFQVLYKLRETYGPVVSVQLGRKSVVVLNSLEILKEALGKPAFSGRPFPMPFQIGDEVLGFVDQSGPEWREQRQFSLKVLQTLGFGTIRMENYITDEITCLLEHLKSVSGQTSDIFELIMPYVGNIINALVFGRRLDKGDPKRTTLDEIAKFTTPCFRQVTGVYFLPKPFRVLFKAFSEIYKVARKYLSLQNAILEEEITQHSGSLEESNPRDYIDKYLIEMKNPADKHKYFNKINLVGNLRLLMGAGSDTILAALQWLFVAMAVFPEIQDKVREEVDSAIGDRNPAYSDQSLMPYTQAVILEIHRWRTNIPLNVLRRTTGPSNVGGFNLPENTTVIANLWAAHNDPDLWDNPEDYRPDRFLTEEGQIDSRKTDMIATFAFGPRSCPGKALANLEIFLFFVNILQRFCVSVPLGMIPTLDGYLEISYKPLQNHLVFTERL